VQEKEHHGVIAVLGVVSKGDNGALDSDFLRCFSGAERGRR
jgi:hypothetical protein